MRWVKVAALAAAGAMAACGAIRAPGASLHSWTHLEPRRAELSAAVSSRRAPDRAWPQERSDLKPDPALRFGRLPNGMGYVLMKNATPAKQASLRLRIAAGALEERDDQQGLMHFIEHMAFNGSSHVPQGEMVKILERHGLAFGPDTNAFTSFDQTVYQLDLPETDDETLDTGMMLMRETAGELTIPSTAIESERGVILSEERLRDTPGLRIARQQFDFYYRGDRISRRFPIGDVKVIRGAGRPLFTDLYDTFYRPDRAVLVAVGDFDLDKMEARIRARFTDWKAKAPDRLDPDLGPVEKRVPEIKVVVEPGGPSSVHIAWTSPPDLRDDTRSLRRERALRQIGFAVLDRRLERLARSAKAPFIAAGASHFTTLNTADVTQISVTTRPTAWREALIAAVEEERRGVRYGVRQAEVDREITEYRAALRAAAQGAATRRTPVLATSITESIHDREVFTSPAEDLAEFDEAVKNLKADAVSAVLARQFQGEGPLIFLTTPAAIEGGETAVRQAFDTASSAEVAPPEVTVARTWSYTDFGPAGQVAERQDVLDLDTAFVRFANGVRLTVKPTKFRDNQVLITVRVGDGYRDLPTDRVTPMWAAGVEFSEGGLGRLTTEELEQVLASRVYGVSLGANEETFTLAGATRPEDFEIQMQVLAAYLTDPAWRPEPFERMRAYGGTLLNQLASTPGGVFGRDGQRLLHNGDPRWGLPDQAQMAGAQLSDLRTLVSGPLSTEPIEVVIVGDVSVDETIRQTALTFGALPPRQAHPQATGAQVVRFPAPAHDPVRLTHRGRSDQAIGFVAWPTTDYPSSPQTARELRVLEQVIQLRLIDELREKQGVTYSPSTGLESSWVFPGYGYVSASIEAPADKLSGFFQSLDVIAKDLQDKPVSPDELERARKPRVEAITKAQQTNEYWLSSLGGAQEDRRKLDAVRSAIAGLQRVTPADVQKAARTWLTRDRAWRLMVVPEMK